MGAEYAAMVSVQAVAAVALAFSVCGGITGVRLSRAIVVREGKQPIFGALAKAVRDADPVAHKALWVAACDFLTALAIICIVTFLIFSNEATPSEYEVLGALLLCQATLALMAYLQSRSTLSSQRSIQNGPEPGARHHSRGNHAGRAVVASSKEEKLMRQPADAELAKIELTRRERTEFVRRGMEHYQNLRPQLEREHRGDYVAISVKTGRYETARDDAKLKKFADSLSADDFLWMTRVRP